MMESKKSHPFRIPATYIVSFAAFLLLAPIILTGRTIFWGTIVTQFLPWRVYAWESLLQGSFPLWNPLVGAGAPLLANYQSAILYPPNWISLGLYVLGGVPAAARGESILLLFHLIIAGVGMAQLMSELGVNQRGQRVSGLAFGLSSYIVARGSFASLVAAVAWTPWVILFIERLAKTKASVLNRNWFGLTIVVALLLLAGHAQSAWYILLLAGAWALVRPTQLPGGSTKKTARLLLVLVMSLVLGVLLTSVQLLPTYEYLQMSPRAAEVDYEIAMTYSFWPWRLLTFFAPDLFGNPRTGDYIGYASFWEDAVYIGLLPILLAISTVIATLWSRFSGNAPKSSKRGKLVFFLLVIVVVGVILALGNNTPIFPYLYRHIPTFDMFKSPARWLLWTVFGLAVLAGFGADAWQRPTGRWLYWSRLGTAAGVAVTLGAGLGWLVIGDVSPTFIKSLAITGVFGVAAGALNLSIPLESAGRIKKANRRVTIWELALTGFIILDLLVAGWGLNPALPVDVLLPDRQTLNDVHADPNRLRIYLPAGVEYENKFERFFTLKEFLPRERWGGLYASNLPNINMLSGTPSLNNFDPLIPARYERWMEALENSDPAKRREYLNLSAVGMVGTIDSALTSGIRYDGVQSDGRVRWLPCAVFAEDGEDALELAANETIDLSTTVVLEGVESAAQPGCAQSEHDFDLNFNKNLPAHVVLQVNTPNDGWLLLADTDYPGWKAYVDGREVEMLTGDYLYRTVWLAGGNHIVSFDYRPASFRIGLWLSASGWLILGGLYIWHARRSSDSSE